MNRPTLDDDRIAELLIEAATTYAPEDATRAVIDTARSLGVILKLFIKMGLAPF